MSSLADIAHIYETLAIADDVTVGLLERPGSSPSELDLARILRREAETFRGHADRLRKGSLVSALSN